MVSLKFLAPFLTPIVRREQGAGMPQNSFFTSSLLKQKAENKNHRDAEKQELTV